MSSRLFPVLLLTAALAFACGPRSRANEPEVGTRSRTSGQPLASSLDVRVADGVRFALHVTNEAQKSLELTFPDGQTHDIVVLDAAQREVWRWSDGRMFTQALQTRVLDEDETASYEAAWPARSVHGAFTAVASLRSENHPVEQRVRFVIP